MDSKEKGSKGFLGKRGTWWEKIPLTSLTPVLLTSLLGGPWPTLAPSLPPPAQQFGKEGTLLLVRRDGGKALVEAGNRLEAGWDSPQGQKGSCNATL